MGLKLIEVKDDEEFDELFQVWRAAFTNPGTKLWKLFTADGISNVDSQPGRPEYVERFIAWHRVDPTSTWLKVIDDSNGMVLGGGRWSIYRAKPYDTSQNADASWWPAGIQREIASQCLAQFLATSDELMNRPHVCKLLGSLCIWYISTKQPAVLNILFMHPNHRSKGVASLVMKWGLESADRLGLETFIDATNMGKPMYEKFGFSVVDNREFSVETKSTTREAKKAESELLPFTWWSMLRAAKS